jgi:hypothetical protein
MDFSLTSAARQGACTNIEIYTFTKRPQIITKNKHHVQAGTKHGPKKVLTS